MTKFSPFFPEIMDKLLQYDFGKNFVFKKAKDQVMKMSGGLYPAPLQILEVTALFTAVLWTLNVVLFLLDQLYSE